MTMQKCFIHQDFKVSVNLKSNIKRIAQKIRETKLKDGMSNPFKITDMLRATVFVNKQSDMIKAYNILEKKFEVIRIKNKLNTPLQNIHINIMFERSIIGEI